MKRKGVLKSSSAASSCDQDGRPHLFDPAKSGSVKSNRRLLELFSVAFVKTNIAQLLKLPVDIL
jgi:hypothetical protein